MKYWFVVHDLMAYNQHNNLIGCRVREEGVHKPKYGSFAKIKKSDKIIYYATKHMVVVGVFDVVTNITYLPNDPHWKEIMVFGIRPSKMPPSGYYLNFKKLVLDKNVQFDLFPKKRIWARYLQGHTCRELTEKDFDLIASFVDNQQYLIKTEKLAKITTAWHKRRRKRRGIQEPLSAHEKMVETLMTMGSIFGFESFRTPRVNQLRPPDSPFRARGKNLDIAWKIFDLTWVPIEVQVHGSIPDLIYRLNLVHQWALRMVVVADQDFHDEINEVVSSGAYPFAGKLVVIAPKEIEQATKSLGKLKELREKIFG
jgi:hypothetical protein